ncbi:flagellin lysine-N-methylase [Aeromonas australiensis]|uniref:flagellin lysine-N-methylase n=1 Tax=Aeromonas australiensis TaxID=1114880 RepID=UPI001FCD471D|nr:flagellin lysine-N-methylase [Aeromonas australiensis]
MTKSPPAHQFVPVFFKNFQCIGDKCEDTCCRGWNISIDKKTYRTYSSHPDLWLRTETMKHIQKVKKDDHNWGQIILNEEGYCPFLSDGWCQIHKEAGVDALSNTCRSYPRVETRFGDNLKLSLTLSCPEVCRQVLLNPDAMAMEVQPFKGFYKTQLISEQVENYHLFSIDILLTQGISIEEKLWIIGLMLHRSEDSLPNQQFLAQIGNLIDSGELHNAFLQIPYLDKLQWWALHHLTQLQLLSNQKKGRRGRVVINYCLHKIKELFSDDGDITHLAKIHDVWHKEVEPFLNAHPHIMQNYLVYYVYHHNFPLDPDLTPQQCYQLMIADYFLLRSYLCLIAMSGPLTVQDVTNLFYSYHCVRMHNKEFEKAMAIGLNQYGSNNDVSLYALLNTTPPSMMANRKEQNDASADNDRQN